MEYARRLGAHAADELRQGEHAALNELSVCYGERGLQPDDAERRVVERRFLLVVGVWRVIAGDAVDDAVFQCATERGHVGRLAQWRIHLRMRVVLISRGPAPRAKSTTRMRG